MSVGDLIGIIDGKYMIVEVDYVKEKNYEKLRELIAHYKLKLKSNLIQSQLDEPNDQQQATTTGASLEIVESKDGADVYAPMLKMMGVSMADLEATVQQNHMAAAASTNETALSAQQQQQPANSAQPRAVSLFKNGHFVCFLIYDFDQDDRVFAKLEDVQSRFSSYLANMAASHQLNTVTAVQRRIIIYGWPILYHCIENNLNLANVTDVDRPLYCKLLSGCFVCFTGFKKENKNTVAHCIKLVHYMGGSVRKEYNKKITHLIVKSTLSTKYKTAYNIGRCNLLTEDWIIEAWKHRNEINFNVNDEDFLKKFKLKALYSLNIAFYGFTKEETQHMKEVTIENGGTPINDINDPNCTHIVINDQEVKQLPTIRSSSALSTMASADNAGSTVVVEPSVAVPVSSSSSTDAAAACAPACQSLTTTATITPTSKSSVITYLNTNMSPFSNTRAHIVRTEWFWVSIQICCRASECLYEFTKPKSTDHSKADGLAGHSDPPNKRIKLSLDNLLSHDVLNLNNSANAGGAHGNGLGSVSVHHSDSPHNHSAKHGLAHTPTTMQTPNGGGGGGGNMLSTTSTSLLNSVLNNSAQKSAAAAVACANAAAKISSNNLLASSVSAAIASSSCDNYDSPTLINSSAHQANQASNHRLSTNRNNMSHNNLSTSASLLDATADDAMSIDSPFEKHRDSTGHGLLNSASSNGANGNNSKKMTKRSQRIYELYETEKRFVNILHTIICYFKEPIEAPDQVAGPILDQTETKEIFGNLPPIYEVHCKIKERLERLVNRLAVNEETISVGDIYMDNSEALLKTYPPFVNFYEKTKDAINNCDKIKPRFHAFLKIAQSKPECGRQTLVELLIRPVQRLPSTLLLLDDILKETPKTHKDHELLTKAIGSLKEVMTHINEDKRKIENQLAMFVLINDIENCPATLLSSHRSFLKKLDVYEMSNELLKKGAQLTLFLFTDCLEICKPRLKLLNAAKSPNAASKQRTPQKCYKHISLFSLNNVTKVCDIQQKGDDTDLFGILCRLAGEKDKFFSFKVIASNCSNLSANLVNTTNMANANGNPNATGSLMSQNASMMVQSNSAYGGFSNTAMMSSSSSLFSNVNNYSSICASSTNLHSTNNEYYQAILEKKDYLKLLAQGICNVKCITEFDNILCSVEAHQLQIDLNESEGLRKLDAVKSYARRVSRAFSFQDTPNKIKKTISSVFRSPFQSSYSQQSLNEQKASKLTSLASLQLTPTLIETKRKFIQKSAMPLISPPKSGQSQQKQRSSNHPMHLLSTRTLRSLRSTTTSTINGIAAAMSTSMSSASSSSSSSASGHQSASKMSHYYSSVKQINKSNSANGDLSENCAESKCSSSKSDDENDDEVDVDDDDENYDEMGSGGCGQHSTVKIGQQMKRSSEDCYDQQSINGGELENENPLAADCGPHFFKQQLAQNKSKKQLLMSSTNTGGSSSQFGANVSNKLTAQVKRVDTL